LTLCWKGGISKKGGIVMGTPMMNQAARQLDAFDEGRVQGAFEVLRHLHPNMNNQGLVTKLEEFFEVLPFKGLNVRYWVEWLGLDE
jgi:hypothetical protein